LSLKTRKWGVLPCISGNPTLIYPEISSILHLTGKSPLNVLLLSMESFPFLYTNNDALTTVISARILRKALQNGPPTFVGSSLYKIFTVALLVNLRKNFYNKVMSR